MELKDWLNSINYDKKNVLEENPDNIKVYPSYIINRCLSGHIDCVLYANEMNMYPNLSKDMQYHFYLNCIRKKKRFSPWMKKEKISDVEAIKKYYHYSDEKSHQVLKILNSSQINIIKSRLETGGQNGK